MEITVGEYLLRRLKELGIGEVFGVPGDYNLGFLDQIVDMDDLAWCGACNELNGAYAADGYARIRGVSALVTTFGVGELSAINGIAGAYAEHVPIINIVGMPSSTTQSKHALVHHTLGEGHFNTFIDMYRHVTIEQAILTPFNAAREIDRVLTACWLQKRPVYIGIPTDVVTKKIELENIKPLSLAYPQSDPNAVDEAVERTTCLIEKAQSPLLITDFCAQRHPMKSLIETLVIKTGIRFANMNMGKGLLNESMPHYLGVYSGDYSSPGVQEQVEQSDCLITFGSMLSDFNTGGFTVNFNPKATIEVHSHYVQIKYSRYDRVYFSDFIPALVQRLAGHTTASPPVKQPRQTFTLEKDKPLIQARFWPQIAEFLQEQDIVIAETGTSMFGTLLMPLPDETTYITQALWGSIGYTVGALLGTVLAAPERQSILFIGDGSFQLTAQELSTMLRHDKNPIIFLINNDGYTVERVIHGPAMPYNDIQMWKYSELPSIFGENTWSTKASTESELNKVLQTLREHDDKLRFVEVMMGKHDSPEMLKKLGEACAKENAY